MKEFSLPFAVLALIIAGFALPAGAAALYLVAIAIGLVTLGADTAAKLLKKKFSLDYIAILAMIVAAATREFLAGAVISLMILVSEALEAYGSREAEAALRHLAEKIPKSCRVQRGETIEEIKIQDVREGDLVLVRPQEIVPLDGYLASDDALMDEANLTGEMEPQPYRKEQFMKSGLVNAGATFALRVSGTFETSTYQKIVELVREAKSHPAQLVRLAERYNYLFTGITLALASIAYFASHGDPSRLLAVLVIATPCPLLIAAPISFLGGMNAASKRNIIVKRPAALETLAGVTAIFFDKTGTLTLGEPELRSIRMLDAAYSEQDLLAIAAAIELHSLHPLAKAIVRAKEARITTPSEQATHIVETPGEGIAGFVRGAVYRLKKYDGSGESVGADNGGIVIEMSTGGHPIARFTLDDVIKPGTIALLRQLESRYRVAILTGDTEENAERLFGGDGTEIHARCAPEEKFAIVKAAQEKNERVMMVGDGLNDAPALAAANVGVVFSGTENSASIDAAAVAILSRDIGLVSIALGIARNATRIATQSILWGIGLSTIGMIVAAAGGIPPINGAILQECIDVAVILNALRAARPRQ